MEIVQKKLCDIKPYKLNAKNHPQNQVKKIAESIVAFGFNQPVVVDEHNVIIVGHGRYLAAELLKLDTIPTLTVKISEEEAKAYRLADNKLNESSWDMALVIDELKELQEKGFNIELTGFSIDDITEHENPYTTKIETPVYEISGEKPSLSDLVGSDTTDKLQAEIASSGLSTDEKKFLVQASKRHLVFHYDKIAEYYAHADKEMQELMEKSALVIIDFDKSIENGYTKLSSDIIEQFKDDYDIKE